MAMSDIGPDSNKAGITRMNIERLTCKNVFD